MCRAKERWPSRLVLARLLQETRGSVLSCGCSRWDLKEAQTGMLCSLQIGSWMLREACSASAKGLHTLSMVFLWYIGFCAPAPWMPGNSAHRSGYGLCES